MSYASIIRSIRKTYVTGEKLVLDMSGAGMRRYRCGKAADGERKKRAAERTQRVVRAVA